MTFIDKERYTQAGLMLCCKLAVVHAVAALRGRDPDESEAKKWYIDKNEVIINLL